MSTEYFTNIDYDYFIKEVKDIELQDPDKPLYIMPHKRMYLNGNYIWVFKETENRLWLKNHAIFERRGNNDPTDIFNSVLKQFPWSVILIEYGLLKWPEC
jgi:hypothetical protein